VPYFDKSVRLLDAATGCPDRVLRLPEATEAQRAHFFPTGGRLVSCEVRVADQAGEKIRNDQVSTRLRLWDVAAGKQIGTAVLPGTIPSALAPCPDGRSVVVSGWRVGVAVYDLVEGGERWRLEAAETGVDALALSPDGRVLAAPGEKDTVRLWEVASGKELFALRGHRHPVSAVAISPDGRVVASGDRPVTLGADRGTLSVRLWDVATGAELTRLGEHTAGVTALAFTPDGKYLAGGLADGSVLAWDVARTRRPPRAAPRPPTSAELEALWADLAAAEGRKAHRAVWALAEAPKQAVPFLGSRLRPAATVDEAQVRRWVTELDNPRFAVRQAAVRALEELGDSAEQALARALKGKRSLETRRRLEVLLRKHRGIPSAGTLRALRAVQVFELAGTAEARQLLERLAGGAAAARLTREAQAALGRLSRPQGTALP
jgi:hypothetical protein